MPSKFVEKYSMSGQQLMNGREATQHALTPGPYEAEEGAIETLDTKVQLLREVVSRLVGVMHDSGIISDKQLTEILGPGYEIAEFKP